MHPDDLLYRIERRTSILALRWVKYRSTEPAHCWCPQPYKEHFAFFCAQGEISRSSRSFASLLAYTEYVCPWPGSILFLLTISRIKSQRKSTIVCTNMTVRTTLSIDHAALSTKGSSVAHSSIYSLCLWDLCLFIHRIAGFSSFATNHIMGFTASLGFPPVLLTISWASPVTLLQIHFACWYVTCHTYLLIHIDEPPQCIVIWPAGFSYSLSH